MKQEPQMTTPLDPIVSEFATVEEAEAYDKWFREKVRRSMADTRPRIPHDEAMARIRAKLDAKIREKERSGS
ncbi:stability determinant [Caballeronia sp. LZ065]|uniref:type II toxin-antitoxin system RelB family antitoxin n=2 Tax=unclassified Caballeronia TaxID=2646786 RepID=UPI00285E0F76|nr:stability determinant [Caballeronia sp. LZ065]MDR5783427.1 stability determinant [Caballeronia sp. LZ065]